jgi:predicted O-methyltransferase YrrM
MEWSERGITLEGTRFRVGFGPEIKPDPTELLLMKPRWMVERYAKLIADLHPKRMFELGIYHGGSVAFLALLAKPDRHVAIDLQPSPSRRFEEWLGTHGDVVRAYYGIDQADATALSGIVADEFADEPLDLVIDDASHLLDPTRSSFNVLFPLLRPGGVYVVEDWELDLTFDRQAAQDPVLANRIQQEIAKRPELENVVPLTRLLFEIVLASAYTDLIEEMEIRPGWLSVTKGAETESSTAEFDVRRCSFGMGQGLLSDTPNSDVSVT